ncbi:MAG: glycoside hydrolase family 3 N-terminal domain-containing protein [Bacteroidia bacterium]
MRKNIFSTCVFIAFIICSQLVNAASDTLKLKTQAPPFLSTNTTWVDSVFNSLTPDERLGQLFMVAAYSNLDKKEHKKNKEELEKLIRDYKIGGLIFFQGGPARQAILENEYQSISKTPLLIAMDAEWGLAMRLDSTVKFPHQMTLGAIENDSLIYDMGRSIALQCKRLGVQLDFAPVIDINSNPLNPIIGTRSFGENKFKVAQKGLAYMSGLQDEHVISTAKHFPGHGDTDADSHKTLPVVNHSVERLDTLELYPFRQLFSHGISSTMVAHLYIPALDSTPNTASTLSPRVVNGLLKTKMDFKGLVFTDALNMKGVSKFYKPGIVDVKALLAGNDVLLFSEDVPKAMEEIKNAIADSEITQADIDARCKKILMAKSWAGLNQYKPVDLKGLYEDLNPISADLLNRKITEQSLTLLQNKNNFIPLKRLDTLNIATISVGDTSTTIFQETITKYAPSKNIFLKINGDSLFYDSIEKALKPYNIIVVALDNPSSNPAINFGLSIPSIKFLDKLLLTKKIIFDCFSTPYVLSKFNNIEQSLAVIESYEDNEYTQNYSAQLIFGGMTAQGKLPVTAAPLFPIGSGIRTTDKIRFAYVSPEEIGVSEKKLSVIDSLANEGIKEHAYPGCVVFAAKNGNVFYQKAFGYQTYDKKIPTRTNDIYDLASLTKILATTPSIMRLSEENKIKINAPLSLYLPILKKSNKKKMLINDVMAHQAGLQAWIPFYKNTMKDGIYFPWIYDSVETPAFPIRVAEHLYISKAYHDSILRQIIQSKVSKKKEYLYSDLGFYLLKEIIEKQTKTTLDNYVFQNFYNPLGLTTMGYLPRKRFDLKRIPPTENDTYFRKQLLHGDVQDQGAAMMGGVSGHAGLFSDANDVAIMMQMYLQKGTYGGERYFDSTTVSNFTACQFSANGNRRGLGFDKPEMNHSKESPACDSASTNSFGHSGYTGTFTWADPDNGIVYVFLSNRVNPNASENKLAELNIRTKIQQAIYDAFKK